MFFLPPWLSQGTIKSSGKLRDGLSLLCFNTQVSKAYWDVVMLVAHSELYQRTCRKICGRGQTSINLKPLGGVSCPRRTGADKFITMTIYARMHVHTHTDLWISLSLATLCFKSSPLICRYFFLVSVYVVSVNFPSVIWADYTLSLTHT